MKIFILYWIGLLFIVSSSSGQSDNHIKDPAIGIHFFMDQFPRPAGNSGDLKKGLALSYLEGLSSHFDLSVNVAASFLDYTLPDGKILGQGNLLLEGDASAIAKLFSDRHFFSPFILAGAGVSRYNDYYGIYAPLGAGLQLNFSNTAYLLFNAQYRAALTGLSGHYYYSIGVAGNISRKKRKNDRPKAFIPIRIPPAARDSIRDTDGDGIPDNEDKCPTIPGTVKYHGCPIPDTDGDGINDENDSCPTVPGLARYHGCPPPAEIADSNRGASAKMLLDASPALRIRIADDATKIFFRSNSFELLPGSRPALDDVAALLKENPGMKVAIEGHTDSSGNPASNQVLSERRAASVLQYLVSKGGLSERRLSASGYGSSKPVATNKTPEGRARNRRVELIPLGPAYPTLTH